MKIFDKAKELSDIVTEKAVQFSSDELIADTIVMSVKKQEKINAILRERGSNYRVNDINLQMGIPPTVSFGISRTEQDNSLSISGETPETHNGE